MSRYEETESKSWYCALLFCTFLQYALAITAVGLFFAFYTRPDGCGTHKFFISFNLILCVVVSALSVMPKVQEAQPRSGLLQSAAVTLYTMYLTWSAMANQPGRCRGEGGWWWWVVLWWVTRVVDCCMMGYKGV